jgi:hypothetical protein
LGFVELLECQLGGHRMIRIGPVSIVVTAWIICIATFSVLLPAGAQAEECAQWAINEIEQIIQSNGWTVQFNTKQAETDFHGMAFSFPGERDPEDKTGDNGLVDGSVKGDDFEAKVTWANGSIGVYKGRVTKGGWLSGITHDEAHPESRASWESRHTLDCLTTASSSPQPPPAPPPAATPPAPPKPFESLPPGGTGNFFKQMKP